MIRLSLGSARRELERAARELGEQETVDKARATIVIANAAMVASQHLIEASRAFTGAGEELITTTLHDDMEATSRALAELTGLVRERASAGATAALEPVIGEEQQLRRHLGLRPTPGSAVVTQAGKGGVAKRGEDRADDTSAIGPALDLARLEAETAFAQLVKRSDDRGQILPTASRSIAQHLEYASWLLARASGQQGVSAYTPRIAAVSMPIHKIHTWLRARQGNATLMTGLKPVIRTVDRLRAAVGLDALATIDTPALPDSETGEANEEAREIDAAQGLLATTVDLQFKVFEQGAKRFEKFAALVRPSAESSAWEQIAGGVLISLIGNLMAPGIGLLAASFIAKSGVWRGIVDYAAGSAVDAAQATMQTALGRAKQESPNQGVRERTYFVEGVVLTQARLVKHTLDRVTTLVQESKITAAELKSIDDALMSLDLERLRNGVYQQTSHAFALLQARKGLGVVSRGAGLASESRMDDHFDQQKICGLGAKAATTGVGKLSLDITQPGDELRVRVKKFEVNGMNEDMAIAILDHAGRRLGRLALPLQIAFLPPWGRTSGMCKAIVAVDERGSVEASFGWEGMEAMVRTRDKMAWKRRLSRPTNAALLESPQALFDALRDVVLPRSATRITEGG